VTYWRDFENETGLRHFADEVGSWWRVVWDEVGAAVRDTLDGEDAR
jgi:hypothetical protein